MKSFILYTLLMLFTTSLSAFTFNSWHSGMILEHALEAKYIEDKNFKSNMCNSSCRDIYFTEDILGAKAKITLHFTLNDKMLYRIEVLWSSGVKAQDLQKFTDEVTAFLDKKYGQIQVMYSQPDYHGFSTYKEKKWQPEPNTLIVARRGPSSLALILTDIELKSNHDFEMLQLLKEKKKQ